MADDRSPGAMGLFASSLKEIPKAKLERVFERPAKQEAPSPTPSEPAIEPALPVVKPSKSKERDQKEYDETVYSIDPALIDEWDYVDRPEEEFGDLEELTGSIRAFGQEVPILLRPKKDRFELIYGRRRWRVCRDLGIPVKAFVRKIDDRVAFQKMSLENRNRQDLSGWARALSYKKALDHGLYESQSALAAHLGIDRTTLSNIMVFTKIPGEVAKAIGPMHNVGVHTARALVSLLEDPANEPAVLEVAEQIGTGRLAGQSLVATVQRSRAVEGAETTGVVKADNGAKLFSWRITDRGAVQVTFAKEALKDGAVSDLVERLEGALK